MSLNNNYIDEDLSKVYVDEKIDTKIEEKFKSDTEKENIVDSHITEDFLKIDHEKLDNDIGHIIHNDDVSFDNHENNVKESIHDTIDDTHDKNIIPDASVKEIGLDIGRSACVSDDNSMSDRNIDFPNREEETNDKMQNIESGDNVPNISSTHSEPIMKDDIDGVKDKDSESSLPATDPDMFIDILGNGLLTKRVITKGLGRETRPTHGDSVTIEYKAWNSRQELFAEATETFVIGDGDMVQAFDLALCLAEMQEEFELKTDARFAYGSHGMLPDVQPDEALQYNIKLLSSEDAPDYGTYNYSDRMAAADKKRERGNYLYRREEFSYAVNSYSRAIKIIETDPDFKKSYSDPSKEDMFDLFVKVTNNLAASQLKLESYDSVIETCNTILNYDGNNVKALFRKGKSLCMKGSYDDAIIVLKKAFELDTKNKLIANEIQKCQQFKRHEDEKSARFCRRIFGNETKKGMNDNAQASNIGWKHLFYKYSPYVGAALVTGISIFLATVAISKSKAN